MADKPSSGDTDWGAKLNANLAVGHDSDGTHKKSQMLTDMGWSPTAYIGAESVTLPNGKIVKEATTGGISNGDTITFDSPFTTLVNISFTPAYSSAVKSSVGTPTVNGFIVRHDAEAGITIHWRAVGF